MISRDFTNSGWAAGCEGAPPPLHVYDTDSIGANWHPLPRMILYPQHPGPVMVQIPQPAGAALGDDPTDPSAQTRPRKRCAGMVGWLNGEGSLR